MTEGKPPADGAITVSFCETSHAPPGARHDSIVLSLTGLKNKEMGYRRSRAAMQSFAEWLEELGLGEYAQRFAENGIDLSVLGHLSDQDLKDLGVLLGHRRASW